MNKTIIAITLSLFGSLAVAQGLPAQAPRMAQPTAVVMPAPAPKVQVPTTGTSEQEQAKPTIPSHEALGTAEKFNPFTGHSLTVEKQTLEVEKAKLHTQLLEELLRASTLKEDLVNLPVKKRAEILHQLGGDGTKNLAGLLPPGYGGYLQKEEKKAPVVEAPVRKKAKPLVEAPPAMLVPVITSIIANGANRSVVLEANGQIVIAKEGDNTPFGKIGGINEDGALVGNRMISIKKAVVSRVALTDSAFPVQTAGQAGTAGGQPAGLPRATVLPPLPGPGSLPNPDKVSSGQASPKLSLVTPTAVSKE